MELLRPKWHSTQLETYPLKNFPDLSIDCFWAHPQQKENLIMISTAEHGIEGYVGSAMLKIFMDEFAPRLNADNTGLLLVHTINPWGMKNHRRVNPNHVDLNRNFILGDNYDPAINPDYDLLEDVLNPKRPIRRLSAEALPFLFKAIKSIITVGFSRVQTASLLGQHRNPKGIYFGGKEAQEETLVLMSLYRKALAEYQNFYQIDIHTGYGPRDQMSFLLAPSEKTSSQEAIERFKYSRVQKVDASEFYEVSGDMNEFVYRLRDAEFPQKNVFASGFEFGTYGDSISALIRSLRITVLENQLRHHGATNPEAEEDIRKEYEELFFPADATWREKAIKDGRQAMEGILQAFQLI